MMKKKSPIYFLLLFFLYTPLFAQQHATGMQFDNQSYGAAPRKAQLTRALTDELPSKASVKIYAPYPKNQEQNLTCVAWACAYCGRTIVDAVKNNWTDRNIITQHAYSPAFLFRLIKPNEVNCSSPSVIEDAFRAMKNQGSIPYTNLPLLCVPTVNDVQLSVAKNLKLKDYATLFGVPAPAGIKIQAVKKALSEKKPVVIGMIVPPSFETAITCWIPTEQPLFTYGGHAMCVVGYDDNLYGGAFEIQNSWGENWGTKGYIWIKYQDFGKFVQYAYEFIDLSEVKPNVDDLAGSVKLTITSGEQMPANLRMSTRGLKVVSAQTTQQPLTTYKTTKSYTSGTNFRIYVSNNEPAYVYAISSDLTNEVTKLFPADSVSAVLDYKKNTIALPNERDYITFDEKAGTDFLCLLYSRNELNINDIIAKVSAGTGTFNERIYGVLKDKIVDPKNIKFSNDNIAFTGASGGKDIVALMVELDHK